MQLTLVIIGHYVVWIRVNGSEFGSMMIAGVTGLLYARDFAKGYAKGALGGAIAGGTCGIIGRLRREHSGRRTADRDSGRWRDHDPDWRHRRVVRPDGSEYPQAEG